MTWKVLEGNVFDVLPTLEPGSVDCVVSSPPYWMLRSYLPKGHALKQFELGSEPTPQAFVANMVRVFDLVRDAMADHAVCFLNIGDTYSHARGKRKPGDKHGPKQTTNSGSVTTDSPSVDGLDSGSLCLIPQRLAISLQDAGWIVRSVIVWHKPAPMPCSVTGWSWRRCRVKTGKARQTRLKGAASLEMGASSGTNNHDMAATWADCPGCKKCEATDGLVLRRGSWRPTSSWEPILMLAKSDRYFCDAEAVKLPPSAATVSRDSYTRVLDDPEEQFAVKHDHETVCTGANPRDVWTIASEPLREKHYAAFPTELVTRCLLAGTSSRGYCPACGLPWCRVVEAKEYGDWRTSDRSKDLEHGNGGESENKLCGSNFHDGYEPPQTIGWRPSCNCPPHEPRPGLVLDPFCGSGRTIIAARRLQLHAIGIDLNPEYAAMSRRRISEDNPIFNAVPVYEPEAASMFDSLEQTP